MSTGWNYDHDMKIWIDSTYMPIGIVLEQIEVVQVIVRRDY